VRPGDIVLVDRNCHKSHHLGLALVGASVVYLEAYPLRQVRSLPSSPPGVDRNVPRLHSFS
jgi:arginine/lysine/ornithine decarboxylase